MSTLFVSDLHLDAERPDITSLFLRFLDEEAHHADALFILGDLFEAWVGDDDDAALATTVADGLKRLAERGVPVRFIRGNRDFLLGHAYAERSGFDILPDPCVVLLYDEPVLLLHGDLLCTDDTGYVAVRRQVRDPAWQHGLLMRSLDERRAFARQARSDSASHQTSIALDIGDATASAVESTFRRFDVSRMIHGHTHRPAVHDISLNQRMHQRIVLGDWYTQGSVLHWHSDGTFKLAALL